MIKKFYQIYEKNIPPPLSPNGKILKIQLRQCLAGVPPFIFFWAGNWGFRFS
jgi:hypothetical protein